ncbi:hypothetical protein K0M31_003621 [Melipona bicolor]|uniref:Uncharacterized protein n=1 Tax=Melipona bicolor TaxID=60889 RepID=A0AA40FZI7_9HYME|nr:hypothetical protein K0M31_003621 [Melipona bicolor]
MAIGLRALPLQAPPRRAFGIFAKTRATDAAPICRQMKAAEPNRLVPLSHGRFQEGNKEKSRGFRQKFVDKTTRHRVAACSMPTSPGLTDWLTGWLRFVQLANCRSFDRKRPISIVYGASRGEPSMSGRLALSLSSTRLSAPQRGSLPRCREEPVKTGGIGEKGDGWNEGDDGERFGKGAAATRAETPPRLG